MPTALLVEDSPTQRYVLAGLLKRARFDVSTAGDAPAALALLADGLLPDLVMLDLELPGMDGLAFLQVARQTLDLRSLRVIAISANFPEKGAMVQEVLRSGVSAFIEKPVTQESLWAALGWSSDRTPSVTAADVEAARRRSTGRAPASEAKQTVAATAPRAGEGMVQAQVQTASGHAPGFIESCTSGRSVLWTLTTELVAGESVRVEVPEDGEDEPLRCLAEVLSSARRDGLWRNELRMVAQVPADAHLRILAMVERAAKAQPTEPL